MRTLNAIIRWTMPLAMLAAILDTANAVPSRPLYEIPAEAPIERTYVVILEGTSGGFCTWPGSRVDVIGCYRNANNEPYARIVASNVLVIDCQCQLDENGEMASPRAWVRFQLTPQQAATLDVANLEAMFCLALRCQEPEEPAVVVFAKDILPRRFQFGDIGTWVQQWVSSFCR
jgi:Flp pilus assembly protein CpaB